MPTSSTSLLSSTAWLMLFLTCNHRSVQFLYLTASNMSTSAILDFPNVTLYIVKWNVLFRRADTSLPSQENPSIWRYCIMRFFTYLFFLMAPKFLALATTLENLGARRLLAKKVNFVPWVCFVQLSCARNKYSTTCTRSRSSSCVHCMGLKI